MVLSRCTIRFEIWSSVIDLLCSYYFCYGIRYLLRSDGNEYVCLFHQQKGLPVIQVFIRLPFDPYAVQWWSAFRIYYLYKLLSLKRQLMVINPSVVCIYDERYHLKNIHR